MQNLTRFLIVLIVFALPYANCLSDNIVKKSKRAICHGAASPYYSNIKHFQPFASLEGCIKSGGKLPKISADHSQSFRTKTAKEQDSRKYHRSMFGGWIDKDQDCQNTRHETLIKLSVSRVDMEAKGCTVSRGLWNDPYTGMAVHQAKGIDIDHLVPLKWAWIHGASLWSPEKRSAFANDENNLFAVTKKINQEKGAKGPLEWLPPNEKFHCSYVRAFNQVIENYTLALSNTEANHLQSLQLSSCGD